MLFFCFRYISFSAVLALEEFHCIRIETVSFYTIRTNRDVIGRKVISGRMCLKTSMVNILSDVKDTPKRLQLHISCCSYHFLAYGAAPAVRAAVTIKLSF